MRRNWRVALAALGTVALGAVLIPTVVSAQKVANPGRFELSARTGQITVGTGLDIDLTPNPLPQCSDGIDNDGDGRIDLADPQCVAGPQGQPASEDDSELMPGFQPKVDVSIIGSIDADGNITVPASDVVFPPTYIRLIGWDGSSHYVTVRILPVGDATGTLNANTGATNLQVRARVGISGSLGGNPIPSSCGIGTTNNPIVINLTSGRMVNNQGATITGSPYNTNTGTAVLVENNFAVPGASNCQMGLVNVADMINQTMGLPSGAGRNRMVLVGDTAPVLKKAINPVIVSDPTPLHQTPNRAAPLNASFSAADSTVVAPGAATYLWEFSDGTTATGVTAQKNFESPGTHTVSLTVTDSDGDSATVSQVFNLVTGGATTTTTAPTTTAPTTTAPTTTAPTTTAPTTTAPTTTAPTTTAPTTTAPTTTAPTTTAPTTTAPTTTAPTTTVPAPSNDEVSIAVTGALNYANSGSGNGDITVRRDMFGLSSVKGSLQIPGASGGTATVRVDVTRAWILPLWTGEVSVNDPDAGVRVTAPVFGEIRRGDTELSARATSSWFVTGAFPNLIRPFNLTWSVVDAD